MVGKLNCRLKADIPVMHTCNMPQYNGIDFENAEVGFAIVSVPMWKGKHTHCLFVPPLPSTQSTFNLQPEHLHQ